MLLWNNRCKWIWEINLFKSFIWWARAKQRRSYKGKTERLSVLKQDHFAYEDFSVIDTVIMGNEELYKIRQEKDAIYAKPDFSEEDGMKAAKLEERFAELDGWNSEADASQLLNELGIETENHYKKCPN